MAKGIRASDPSVLRMRRTRQAWLAVAAINAVGFYVDGRSTLLLGNTADTFKMGSSLAAAGNWTTSPALPSVSNDALFGAAYPATSPLVGVLSSGTPNYGSLNDINANAVSIGDNSSTANTVTLTLGGASGSDSITGSSPADLIYVANGSNLTILSAEPAKPGALSLILGQSGNIDAVGSLNISSNISSSGTYSLNKIGAGITQLSGSNTYSGGTTVSAGELRLNNTTGSGTGGGAVTVQPGALLGGSGTVGNGTLSIGVSGTITAGPNDSTTGTLTTGSQTWNAGGTFMAKVTDSSGSITGNDKLVISALTVAATSAPGSLFNITVSSLSGSASYAGTPLVLAVDGESSASNPFSSANSAATLATFQLTTPGLTDASGGTFQLSTQADSSSGYDLVLSDIPPAPEPAGPFLLGVAAVPYLLARRRRASTGA